MLPLRKKILIWFLVIISISFILVLPTNLVYFFQREKISKTIKQIEHLNYRIQKIRNIQTDFFSYDIQKRTFYNENNSFNYSLYLSEVKQIKKELALLKNNRFIIKSKLDEYIQESEINLNELTFTFQRIVNMLRIRGFKDEGVIGNMRANIHKAEEHPGGDKEIILMLRRHEKDYIIRNDMIYVTMLNELAEKYKYSIRDSYMPKHYKDSLYYYVSQYSSLFNYLVAIDTKTGLKDNSSLKHQLDISFAEINNLVNSIAFIADNYKNNYFRNLEILYIIVVVIMITLSFFLSYYFSKLISKPLQQLTSYISKLKSTNFSYDEPLNIDNPHKEIFFLYTEFRKAIEQIKIRETERDLAEKSLRYNEIKYRELAEFLPQGIFETDNTGLITYVNKAWLDLFGYTRKDIRDGINFKDLLLIPDKNHFLDDARIFDIETMARKKNGSEFNINLYTNRIYKDSKLIGIRGILIDVTQKTKFINELQIAKTRAEQSDKLKSAFLANMSHEIRTPMNAIIGFSALLSDPTISSENQKDYIKYIQSSGEQLLKLIDDIIDIAKIEAGELKIKKDVTLVNSTIVELQTIFNQLKMMQGKNIDIIINPFYSSSEFAIFTDPTRFRQILTNLINNAYKFTHSGYIEIAYAKYGNTLQFYVKDTGIGIFKNMQDSIFDRFVQADHPKGRQFGGTGLGLTITKHLVNLLGGKIWVNSEPNVGSTFYFTLPFEPVNMEGKLIQDADDNYLMHDDFKFEGLEILVAEDNDMNYELAQTILSQKGIIVSRANNGKEAIMACLNNEKLDLILLDMEMPEMSGYEAIGYIRNARPSIPVIAQTAHAMAEDKANCLEIGCNEYISKPIDAQSLFDAIKRCIIQHRELIMN